MDTNKIACEFAEACRLRAIRTASPFLRENLLSIAKQHDRDADLLERSLKAILESEQLIAQFDELLVSREASADQNRTTPSHEVFLEYPERLLE
jgi:hypothetical protein